MFKSYSKALVLLTLLFPVFSLGQSLKVTPANIVFPTRMKFQTDSIRLVVENTSGKTLHIDDINLFNGDFFIGHDSMLTLNNGQKDSFYVFFRPRHNIEYNTELVLVCREQGAVRIDLKGTGQYPGTYYSATFNKNEQQLKDQLKTTLGTGYMSQGYNGARDWMYMTVDNQKFNGYGATTNTIECVYTGRRVKDYTSRADAQTNGNLNTEHTYPQSKFGSVEPTMSDMFHLFIVDGPSNSVRSNYPFSVVASPTWQNGGSKYAGGFFEPRDQHKGNAARAMLYIGVRYQNYDNFLTSQESILRKWALEFPPTVFDSLRNEKIYTIQKNRNPFIDHPEFLERITSISNNSVAPVKATYTPNIPLNGGVTAPVMIYGQGGDTAFYNLVFTATGNQPVNLSYSLTGTSGVMLSTPNSSVAAGESASLQLKVIKNQQVNETDTLLVTSAAGNTKVPLVINITSVSVGEPVNEPNWFIYPNPSDGHFYVRLGEEGVYELVIYDVNGKKVHSTVVNNTLNEINVSGLRSGYYFVSLSGSNRPLPCPIVIR